MPFAMMKRMVTEACTLERTDVAPPCIQCYFPASGFFANIAPTLHRALVALSSHWSTPDCAPALCTGETINPA